MKKFVDDVFEANPAVNSVVAFECGNVFDATKVNDIAAFEKAKGVKGTPFEREDSKPKTEKPKTEKLK